MMKCHPEQPLRDGDCQDSVIGEPAVFNEEREVLGLGARSFMD